MKKNKLAMRKAVIILSSLALLTSCGQPRQKQAATESSDTELPKNNIEVIDADQTEQMAVTSQLFEQNIKRDTIFFMDTTFYEGFHINHSIFIDYDTNNKFYDKVVSFDFGEFDESSYKSSIDYLKENNLTLTKAKPVIPWTNWVILKQYQGKFYAYHPCDFCSHFRQSVNDTTFIDWGCEGPTANKIIKQKKIDNTTYEFKLKGVYPQDRKLTIHIIDLKKGIAVFERTINATDTGDTETYYYLMIAADKVRSVPVIVNHCTGMKQNEFDFDEPDFVTLLKTK
jgi:hypothetical protein